jgi:hypothetical protein
MSVIVETHKSGESRNRHTQQWILTKLSRKFSEEIVTGSVGTT